MVTRKTLLLLTTVMATVSAWQPQTPRSSVTPKQQQNPQPAAAAVAATGILSALLLTGTPVALANDATSAQITLNSLPPSSVEISIGDLPVIGSLVSGTYTKVPDGSLGKGYKPSVVITSPSDKVKAIADIATSGHLGFDVHGSFINTHLDVDVATDEAGVARVRVASPLIPKLPFKNLASASGGTAKGGKASPWKMVTDMGNGESYYYNEQTGVTQIARPDKF
jgi:hypothetical protein